jgi:dTDP-glucose 4,6-dehydratase
MSWQPDRLLVTGGAGFIGANFVRQWHAAHPAGELVVLDALTYAGNRANLADLESAPGYTFVKGDICDQPLVEDLLRRHALDGIVHFAAESHVDRSITGPDEFVRTNVIGTHSLLKASRRVWLDERKGAPHRFHHVSTDEVYGSLGPDDPAFTEDTTYSPNSPYSASKAASDHLVRAYAHTYGLATTTTNCSNNYGPYQFPEKLIPLMIVNLLEGSPLPVYGDGRNVRDWLFVGDHCAAISLVLECGKVNRTYNIGGRAELENIDLVHRLCAITDEAFASSPALKKRFPNSPAASGKPSKSLITYVKDRPGHDRRYAINSTRIERELGFEPTLAVDEGLRRTFRWYLDNEAWWRAIQDGSYRG